MRKWSVLVALAVVMVVAALVVPATRRSPAQPAPAQEAKAEVVPILKLEKPQYVLGEQMRIWVGMYAPNNGRIPFPDPKQVLIVQRPDGTTVREESPGRADGMVSPQWLMGGWGLTDKVIGPGTYHLELTVEGYEQVATAEVEVIQWGDLDKIKGGFRFEREGQVTPDEDVAVTLFVTNGTQHTIRFPIRGYPGKGEVYGAASRRDERDHRTFFYPEEGLLPPGQPKFTTQIDAYNWKTLDKIPSVVLKPGETFEQELSIQEMYATDSEGWRPKPGGTYEVSLSTTLDLLVGDAEGPLADACPMRVPIKGSALFEIQARP